MPDVAQAIDRVLSECVPQAATVDDFDGITVSHWDHTPPWWFNVRASNTEPLLRLNVEAIDHDTMAQVRDRVLESIRRRETA